jgi:hypothetical protein
LRNELVKLQNGLDKLKTERQYRPETASGKPQIAYVPIHTTSPGQSVEVTAAVAGHGKIHPDLEKTAPYVIVRLER